MFKFNFEIDEDEEKVQLPHAEPKPVPADSLKESSSSSRPITGVQDCHHVTLDELLDAMPESISYSPLHMPFLSHPLLRRDLYDTRFQLANTSGFPAVSTQPEAAGEEDEYVDALTDLIPGLYEGGLKTWEGGMDLVEVLAGVPKGAGEWVRGSQILEVGCGTAMPSAYILRSLLNPSDPCHPLIASSSIPSPSQGKTTLHLQDYNRPVLSLVTLPNLLLAALPFLPAEAFHQPDEAADVEALLPDLDKAGEVAVTEALKGAFKGLLEERGVQLRFTFGHWAGLAKELAGATGSIGSGDGEGRYGLVMSAETIYAEDSANDLIAVLRGASQCGERTGVPGAAGRRKEEVALEDSLGDLSMMDAWANAPLREGESVVLIAAKVLYFGVGGGLQSFLSRVEEGGGWWIGVKEWTKGVGRKVVRLRF